MKVKPFLSQRLSHIRRMRLARRLYKNTPVFALIEMQRLYQGYTETHLLADLHPCTKATIKNQNCSLSQYNRYGKIMQLLSHYALTHDPVLATTNLSAVQHLSVQLGH